jgi:hypothetical protein
MSKTQKGNKETKKPKADENRVKGRKARQSRPAAGSEKRPDAKSALAAGMGTRRIAREHAADTVG